MGFDVAYHDQMTLWASLVSVLAAAIGSVLAGYGIVAAAQATPPDMPAFPSLGRDHTLDDAVSRGDKYRLWRDGQSLSVLGIVTLLLSVLIAQLNAYPHLGVLVILGVILLSTIGYSSTVFLKLRRAREEVMLYKMACEIDSRTIGCVVPQNATAYLKTLQEGSDGRFTTVRRQLQEQLNVLRAQQREREQALKESEGGKAEPPQ